MDGSRACVVVTASYGPGFRSLTSEVHDHRPTIDGTIPNWLSGTLVRNGPGRFEVGSRRVNHWFDGLAMLRRYAFDRGELRYSNRLTDPDSTSRGDERGRWRRDGDGARRRSRADDGPDLRHKDSHTAGESVLPASGTVRVPRSVLSRRVAVRSTDRYLDGFSRERRPRTSAIVATESHCTPGCRTALRSACTSGQWLR